MKRRTPRELLCWSISEPRVEGGPHAFAAAWQEAIERFELKGRAGETALVTDGPAPSLLLGIGRKPGASRRTDHRAVFEAAVRAVETARRQRFDRVKLGGVPPLAREAAWRGLAAGLYTYRRSAKPRRDALVADLIDFDGKEKRRAEEVVAVENQVRDLVNTPSNEKTPPQLARLLVEAVRGCGLKREIWDEKRLARERCRGILAVGAGSNAPPRLVRLEYRPKRARRHIVLVGKGLSYDSGGLSLKTHEGLKAMKNDMAGAATVAGVMRVAAREKLPVRLTGFLGLAENMPSGRAYRPGDIIRMRSGKTVEIVNTDCEGRMVLADLLDLAREAKPDVVIELSTLTGACMVALGEEMAGLFTEDDDLARELLAAADRAGELFWRLPMGEDYAERMKGTVSDLKNSGGRYGGASNAAAFLAEFAGEVSWAHLDIAGPAFRETGAAGRPAGATAFAVATLVTYLRGEGGAR